MANSANVPSQQSLKAPPSQPFSFVARKVDARISPYLVWEDRKSEVLHEYTVTGKIALAADFVADNEKGEIGGNDPTEAQAISLEKARNRLKTLDEKASNSIEVTQLQLEQRITKLKADLTKAWDSSERVKSLKIAIVCAKLLSEAKLPKFYPSLFVCVTDILDTFGRLVFERLKQSAAEEYAKMGNVKQLSDDFTDLDVGTETREMTKNWFYKTACIRELLPRLYIELALLESYRFLNAKTDFGQILMRVSHSIRGIGDPLVAVYARWYLARMSTRLVHISSNGASGEVENALSVQRESAQALLSDYVFSLNEFLPTSASARKSINLKPFADTPQVDNATADEAAMGAYLSLHSPAVAWLAHQAGYGASIETFKSVMTQLRDWGGSSAMLLRHVIDGFDAKFFAASAKDMMAFCKLAKFPYSPHFALPDLYRSLALAFARSSPPDDFKLPFLNEVWKTMTKTGNPVFFANYAAALVELLLAHFSSREVLILLGDLVKRLNAAGLQAQTKGVNSRTTIIAPPEALPALEKLLTLIVENEVRRMSLSSSSSSSSGQLIITSEYFGKLLDMFASEKKSALCRRLLAAFVNVPGNITDHFVATTMFEVARAVHDSIDLLTPPDETAAVVAIVSAFLAKVDFGKDLQRMLDLLSDCRRSFTHVDALKAAVIEATISLSMKALRLVKGKHNSKTSQFVRSLFASVATSIAGLDDPFARMELSQQAARAALENNCIGQADLLFRSAIQELPELPQAIAVHIALSASADQTAAQQEERLYELLSSFTKAIIPMPGSPDHGACYLIQGVLTAIQRFPWARGGSSIARCKSTLLLLPVIHIMASPDPFPAEYKIPGVDSNDVLFAGDPKFKEELKALQKSVLEHVIQLFGEAELAFKAGDPSSRAIILEGVPEMVSKQSLVKILSLDLTGSVPFVEQSLLMLRGHAPDHICIKEAIELVKVSIKKGTA